NQPRDLATGIALVARRLLPALAFERLRQRQCGGPFARTIRSVKEVCMRDTAGSDRASQYIHYVLLIENVFPGHSYCFCAFRISSIRQLNSSSSFSVQPRCSYTMKPLGSINQVVGKPVTPASD